MYILDMDTATSMTTTGWAYPLNGERDIAVSCVPLPVVSRRLSWMPSSVASVINGKPQIGFIDRPSVRMVSNPLVRIVLHRKTKHIERQIESEYHVLSVPGM